ncbi:MAG TPA: T9SS type A sorting domain-containing protein [Chitinophagales bacterium]|nr:T9SS type A sorting domain-containing protein [Chitinophagales bacterium]
MATAFSLAGCCATTIAWMEKPYCQGIVNISMYNAEGDKLNTIFTGVLKDRRKFVVKTAQLNAGVYFVTMQTTCESKVLKFIKL